MHKILRTLLGTLSFFFTSLTAFAQPTLKAENHPTPTPTTHKVRWAKISVKPPYLEAYKSYLAEGVQASMQQETGVILLYPVFEQECPNHVTVLEIYADEEAYQHHINTPHFLKYKNGTLHMVETLELIEGDALISTMQMKGAPTAPM